MIYLEDHRMPPRHQPLWMVGLFALILFSIALDEAFADSHTPVFDIYSFSVDAESEVDNDLMRVHLAAQAEHAQAAEVAERINTTMRWATKALEEYPAIRVKTQSYQTYPRHENKGVRRILGWSGSQVLQLETEDFDQAAEAIQTLQEQLQVQDMQLDVQRSTRQAVEQELISSALAAFRERAEEIRQAMESSDYRILDIQVNTAAGGGQPYRGRMAMEASSARSVAAAVIEAGTRAVAVRIDGRIQLQ